MNPLYLAPSGEMVGAIAAVAFFLVLAGAAYVAFKALKKTVKMAVRMIIVMVILAVAVVGSLSLWYFSSDGTQKLKPPAERRR
ncbi:MAG TPA: hypothetical protein VFZ23_04095 [Pyrinomonadaceae bacterium]